VPPLLTASFRVLRLDMRGHGGSDPGGDSYTMEGLGDDVATMLDALSSPEAGDRWNAVDELADWWQEPGVLGRIAVAMLDPDSCVSGRAVAEIRRLADAYEPSAMDQDSVALLGHPGHLARLIELLGDPATCPHGNPIPGSSSRASDVNTRRLTEVGSGERVRLERISEEVELNLGSLTLLGEGGFIPGVVAMIGGRDGDDNLEVRVEGGDGTLHLSSELTDRLFVSAA